MDTQVKVVSKVLVLDSDTACSEQLKGFCEANGLVGLKVTEGHVMSVLGSNVDLGGIFLSASYAGSMDGGLALARQIHAVRPELPIFLRCESAGPAVLPDERDRALFKAIYVIEELDSLRAQLESSIFSLTYPNALVRGIAELTKTALQSQFKDMHIEMETPYLVRDRIIVGEISTLIPLESNWCRGYMMLQAEGVPLLHLVHAGHTHAAGDGVDDFRNLNNVLGEITNLIWGSFKNRYIAHGNSPTSLSQVPIVINHLHRYISFGSEDAQLCFKYTVTTDSDAGMSLTIYQRFIFNLNWSPEDFAENETSVEALCQAGELEMF